MKRNTMILTFAEVTPFWMGVINGNLDSRIEIHVDGDLGRVFIVGLPH